MAAVAVEKIYNAAAVVGVGNKGAGAHNKDQVAAGNLEVWAGHPQVLPCQARRQLVDPLEVSNSVAGNPRKWLCLVNNLVADPKVVSHLVGKAVNHHPISPCQANLVEQEAYLRVACPSNLKAGHNPQ